MVGDHCFLLDREFESGDGGTSENGAQDLGIFTVAPLHECMLRMLDCGHGV